eukprot:scaffold2656_cov227-Pinguiococcus_pyrenoidosus.AAC.1
MVRGTGLDSQCQWAIGRLAVPPVSLMTIWAFGKEMIQSGFPRPPFLQVHLEARRYVRREACVQQAAFVIFHALMRSKSHQAALVSRAPRETAALLSPEVQAWASRRSASCWTFCVPMLLAALWS